MDLLLQALGPTVSKNTKESGGGGCIRQGCGALTLLEHIVPPPWVWKIQNKLEKTHCACARQRSQIHGGQSLVCGTGSGPNDRYPGVQQRHSRHTLTVLYRYCYPPRPSMYTQKGKKHLESRLCTRTRFLNFSVFCPLQLTIQKHGMARKNNRVRRVSARGRVHSGCVMRYVSAQANCTACSSGHWVLGWFTALLCPGTRRTTHPE